MHNFRYCSPPTFLVPLNPIFKFPFEGITVKGTVITVIPVIFWMRRKEPQKREIQPIFVESWIKKCKENYLRQTTMYCEEMNNFFKKITITIPEPKPDDYKNKRQVLLT